MARCWLDFHDPRGTVFLAGTGRSGTTWLAEVLNAQNDFRLLFEPFFQDEVALFRGWWKPHLYLRPYEVKGRYTESIRWVIEGRLRDPWVDHFNRRWIARRRLIKEIRANLFLKWLRTAYPELPIIFLLRHPVACALSQARMEWPPRFDRFLEQPALMEDHLNPYRDLLREWPTLFEARVVMWCCLNWVPLRQMKPGEMDVIFYEDLCRRPAEVLPPLYERIGVRYGPRMEQHLRRLSALSTPASAIAQQDDPVTAWQGQVSAEEVERAMAILRRFGLDRIYDESPQPRLPASECLNLFSA